MNYMCSKQLTKEKDNIKNFMQLIEELLSSKNEINPCFVMQCTEDCYHEINTGEAYKCLNISSYETNYSAIEDLFRPSQNGITPLKIFQRLAIIDSLYSTSVYRFDKFGLERIACELWKLCYDPTSKTYQDRILSNLADDYVNSCISSSTAPTTHPIHSLLYNKYGWRKTGNPKTYKRVQATSLISKYLFFLVNTNSPINLGFPIYDSIIRDIILPGSKTNLEDFDIYLKSLHGILSAIKAANPTFFNKFKMKQFQLLDYVLWQLGKIAKNKKNYYIALLTECDFIDVFVNPSKKHKPIRIIKLLKTFYSKL